MVGKSGAFQWLTDLTGHGFLPCAGWPCSAAKGVNVKRDAAWIGGRGSKGPGFSKLAMIDASKCVQ